MDPLVATALVEKGDFLAPQFPTTKYGYGCILYDYVCDTSTESEAFHNLSLWKFTTAPLMSTLCHGMLHLNLTSASTA